MFGEAALNILLSEYSAIKTVLDVGAGCGDHTKKFLQAKKRVVAIDLNPRGPLIGLRNEFMDSLDIVQEDINTWDSYEQFDCVWASHVLEHQLNVHNFLMKLFSLTKEGGVLAITIPPAKNAIVGGHVTIWNAGLLLYNLVLAGFNCKQARVKKYGYNISLIVTKESIQSEVYDKLIYDAGDLDTLSSYFPVGHNYQGFNGDISELNW